MPSVSRMTPLMVPCPNTAARGPICASTHDVAASTASVSTTPGCRVNRFTALTYLFASWPLPPAVQPCEPGKYRLEEDAPGSIWPSFPTIFATREVYSTVKGADCAICCFDTPSFTLIDRLYLPGVRAPRGSVFSNVTWSALGF